MAEIKVLVEYANGRSRRYDFAKPLVTIGRSPDCDLAVSDPEVSAHHARLRVYDDRVVLEDRNSTNGLFHGGRRIESIEIVGRGEATLGPQGPRLVIEMTNGAVVRSGVVAAGSRNAANVSGAGCVAVATAAAVILLLLSSVAVATTLLVASSSFDDGTVRSVSDEESLSDAVGLVVAGWELKGPQESRILLAGTGTAFAVTPDGHLITNDHVVEEQVPQEFAGAFSELRAHGVRIDYRLWTAFGGELFEAEIVHSSPNQDLCVLKIDRRQEHFFALGTADALPRGSDVFALGFPYSATQVSLSDDEAAMELASNRSQLFSDVRSYFKPRDFEFILTRGAVSRTTSERNGSLWIQHDTAISPGNSGGPLCLQNGIAVGINTLRHTEEAGNSFSFLIGQYRDELDGAVAGLRWRSVD